MPSKINILDPSLGIQSVIAMPSRGKLPKARDLGTNALHEAGLEELYAPGNARQLIEQLLCPDVGDGSVLSPEAFGSSLEESLSVLSQSGEPAVQEFVQKELLPLLQNGQLLQAYRGLMIGG